MKGLSRRVTAKKQEEKPMKRYGVCERCGNVRFGLRIQNHVLIRKCEKCGAERVV